VAALRGDVDAMPLAEIVPDPSSAPDVAQQPLELIWRMSRVSNVLNVLLLVVQSIAAVISLGVALVSLLAPIFLPPQPTLEEQLTGVLPQPLSAIEIALRIAGACVVVALVALTGYFAIHVVPLLFGRPFGISATPSGIDAHTELGSLVHMSWDEMRLLEVSAGDAQARRRFNLYTQGKRIAWTEYRTGFGAQYVPVGATASAIIFRQAALLGLIAARTGLAPRTLAKSLKSKPKPARATNRSTNAIVLLVVALVVAGAAADFLLPMTPLTWVNWVSVGSLAFVTLCLIFASLRAALAPRTLPAHASSPSVGAPVPNVRRVAYVLSWRTAPLTRLLLFIIGLFLAFNLIPGAWALFMLFTPFLPGREAQLLSESAFTMLGRYLLAFVLAIFGVIGLGLAFVGARAATTSIRADKDGLTTRTGPSEQLMAW